MPAEFELQKMWILRKILHPDGRARAAIEFLLDKLKTTKTNAESSSSTR
jgi:transcription termination factor Rho